MDPATYVILTADFTLSSRPEGLPKLPKLRLFKAKSATNIRPYVEQRLNLLEKKTTLQGGAPGSYSCAPNNIDTKSNCRHTKNFTCKGGGGMGFWASDS